MATPKVINGLVLRADGTPRVSVLIRAKLSQGVTIAGTSEVVPLEVTTKTAPDGTYSLSLYSNSDLTPATTYYTVTEDAQSGDSYQFIIVVPSSAGPFAISNIQASAPAPSPPAALDSAVVHLANPETITGSKTFSAAPVVPAASFPETAVASLVADLAAKAVDTAVVHNTGAEPVAGVKTFSSAPVVPAASFPESAVASLTTDLAARALDSAVVHLAGTETMSGDKVHSGRLTLQKDFVHSYRNATEAELVSGLDASLAETVYVAALTANRIMGAPINPVAGHRMKVVLAENSTGGWTLDTSNAALSITNWALNRAANAITELPLEYNGTTSKWTLALNPPSLSSPVTIPGGTGAPQSFRLMGSTAPVGGPPTTGTFQPGDVVTDGTISMVARSLYEKTVRDDGPVGYWRLGDSGAAVVDQLGSNNGAINGGVNQSIVGALTADPDAAMSFNGTTGYVSFATQTGLTFTTGPFSLELWAKIPAFTAQRALVSNRDAAGSNKNYSLELVGSTQLRFYVNGTIRGTSSAVDDNLWHHWVFVLNAAGNQGIYRDGALFVTFAGAAIPATSGAVLAFGRAGAGNSLYFNGSLDEIAIYPSELSATQVTAHYNAGIASFPWAFETAASLTKANTWTKAQTFTAPITAQQSASFQQALVLSKIAAPAAPAAGLDNVWIDSTTGAPNFMGSDGQANEVASGMISTPRTWGGKGDNANDDTSAITSAYGKAGEGLKNLLFVPGGNWKITSQLDWTTSPKNVLVLGAGMGVTFFRPTAFGGSSIRAGAHTTLGGHYAHFGMTGPAAFGAPPTNPTNNAGVDGIESVGAIMEWVQVGNCGYGFILGAQGGNHGFMHTSVGSCYHNVYAKQTGGDDYWIDAQNFSPAFSSFMTDATAVFDEAFNFTMWRCKLNAEPFVFYQADTTYGKSIATNLNLIDFGVEQIGNAFMFGELWASGSTANVTCYLNSLHFNEVGVAQVVTAYRRSDKPSDYFIVCGGSNVACWFDSTTPSQCDKGFLYMNSVPFSDWTFRDVSPSGAIVVINGGTGSGIRWQNTKAGTLFGSATFGAASGNGATKLIGGTAWPGPPASTSLWITPTTDGGLTNGFNIMKGALRSSCQLQVPSAATAALITVAGNIDAGAHSYKVTFENGGLNGQVGSTGGNTASNSVTNNASNAQNTVILPTNGVTPSGAPTVTMSVWRNKVADQTHWFLVQSGIALGTASITDNLADASLGAAMPTTNTTAGWDLTGTLKTTAGQTGNPSFDWGFARP